MNPADAFFDVIEGGSVLRWVAEMTEREARIELAREHMRIAESLLDSDCPVLAAGRLESAARILRTIGRELCEGKG